MARNEAIQFNIRSRFARERAAMIARETGMTTTQVVEEALRAYLPPAVGEVNNGLVRKGGILVKPADSARVSLEEAESALEEVRGERG